MKNWYEVGRVYVWHGLKGQWERLNGTETTVTGNVETYIGLDDKTHFGQMTDTPSWNCPGQCVVAWPGDLRPKDPPPGEKSISDLFKLPQLEPETA